MEMWLNTSWLFLSVDPRSDGILAMESSTLVDFLAVAVIIILF
jgi:hypothetical protein